MALRIPLALEGMGLVKSEDFYRLNHALIFDALCALVKRNDSVDIITRQEALKKHKPTGALGDEEGTQLDEIGGTEYLMRLLDILPSASNLKKHAEIVVEHSTRRKAIAAGMEIIATAQDMEAPSPVPSISPTAVPFFVLMSTGGAMV
jgi:replicative DNA helicase